MIIDSETNFVYFSDLLRTDPTYYEVCTSITTLLDKHHLRYGFLIGTRDIWARDYMPVQIDLDSYVQFRYEPSYLKDNLTFQSDPLKVCKLNQLNPIDSDIILDGGNIIKWHDKAIISKRIFKENPGEDSTKLISNLENLLKAQVILIQDIHPSSDMTGHADGYLRFLDDKTLLVNELKNEFKYWRDDFLKMINKYGFAYKEIPWFEYKEKEYSDSAIGIYMNFLEIRDLIILPIFNIRGNHDQKVFDLLSDIYPNKIIETIQMNGVAREGGLMNCITWNIKI